MEIFYDLVYLTSTIVSLALHVYLIKIAHLLITRGKINEEWLM
jgi:hypothetical protein